MPTPRYVRTSVLPEQPRPRFAAKAGVVTGGASGLGREVLLTIAAEGGSVVVVDTNVEAGEAAAAEACGAGGNAVFQHGDVTREEDIVAAIERAQREFGVFNLMHNNAGIQGAAALHETTTELWDAVCAVNLRAVFWGCKHAVLAMRKLGGGSIVNTASMLALVGDPLLPAYTATKTGVLGLTRAVAVGYAADKIRCNCVCPGDMDTPMNREYFDAQADPPGAKREVEAQYPGQRFAHPREVAMTVAFLLSDDASFVNGTHVVADGGLTAKAC